QLSPRTSPLVLCALLQFAEGARDPDARSACGPDGGPARLSERLEACDRKARFGGPTGRDRQQRAAHAHRRAYPRGPGVRGVLTVDAGTRAWMIPLRGIVRESRLST